MRKIGSIMSPIVIIIVGFLVAKLFSTFMGEWAFIPLAVVYWGLIFRSSYKYNSKSFKDMFHKPQGNKAWLLLSLIIGLIPVVILIKNIDLLKNPIAIVLWLLFALINPVFEEMYWRGTLLNALPLKWKWLAVIYSSMLYAISHPVMWGVFSIANTNCVIVASMFVFGVIWSMVYLKTKSLRWCVVSHFIAELCSLYIFMLLNLYIPLRMFI